MYTHNAKSMNKSVLSLILISTLALPAISCQTEKGNDETQVTDNYDTTTEAVENNMYSVLKSQDFGDCEINILGYGSSQAYNDADSFYAEQTGEVIDDAIYQRNIDTEQLLNVKLVYDASLAERDSQSRFNTSVLAGDQCCDIFIHKGGYFGSFFTAGVLMPWDNVEGLNTDADWYVHSANETIRIGNKQYALFGDVCKTNITMCWTTAFNKRLVEEYKLEDPYEIVKSGNWTMDKLINMTKDIYSDLNGNSEQDEYDIYGYYTDSFATLDAFMVSHGLHATTKDADDFPITDFYNERLVESFEKVYELYWQNSGTYVDTAEPYTYVTDFADGRAAFSPILLDYYITSELRSMDDDYGILPQPKLDESQENYNTYLLGRTGIAMLPADISNEKLSMVGYVLDALNAYSYKYLRQAIYDTSLTQKGARDEKSLEMLELIMDSRAYDFAGFTEIGGSYPFTPALVYRNLLAAKNVNVTSYYESNKLKASDYFDSYRSLID